MLRRAPITKLMGSIHSHYYESLRFASIEVESLRIDSCKEDIKDLSARLHRFEMDLIKLRGTIDRMEMGKGDVTSLSDRVHKIEMEMIKLEGTTDRLNRLVRTPDDQKNGEGYSIQSQVQRLNDRMRDYERGTTNMDSKVVWIGSRILFIVIMLFAYIILTSGMRNDRGELWERIDRSKRVEGE